MFSAHSRAAKPGLFSKRTSQSSGSAARATRKAVSSSTTTSSPFTCSPICSSTVLISFSFPRFRLPLGSIKASPLKSGATPSARVSTGAEFKEKLSESYLDLVVFDYHLVAAQPNVRVSHTLASRHVVFQPVPRADDDLSVVDPLTLPTGFLCGGQGTGYDFRFAKRPGLVRANVGQSVELPPDVEYSYLPPANFHHLVAALRKVG